MGPQLSFIFLFRLKIWNFSPMFHFQNENNLRHNHVNISAAGRPKTGSKWELSTASHKIEMVQKWMRNSFVTTVNHSGKIAVELGLLFFWTSTSLVLAVGKLQFIPCVISNLKSLSLLTLSFFQWQNHSRESCVPF